MGNLLIFKKLAVGIEEKAFPVKQGMISKDTV